MFLDQLTVPAERFGDVPLGTYFVCERDLVPQGGNLPKPCLLVKVAGDGCNWERALAADSVTSQVPETGYLSLDEHIIVLH